MRPSVVQKSLDRILASVMNDTNGDVADYIPELAKVDPDRFGIAVATIDGHVYASGDADDAFTIQSISKAFVYGMVLDEHGADDVLRRVGVEPSGDAFNSIVMDEVRNRPLNPMVNAGAIACAALVSGDGLADRRRRVLDAFGRYAGRELTIDENVCESERRTGHRNRAIAFLELNSGMIDEPVDEHLDLYFAQCSILVTARDLAVMAATLANGGRNPVTGEQALAPEHVSRVLTVMATCGMYDWSGEWMFRIGLPAKSGVGGGIIAVLPGQLGIGTFSPRLDDHGNSCRGVRSCEELGRMFTLHLLDATGTSAPIVRNRYDARQVPSKRLRRTADRALLDDVGSSIVVLELQGDLYFGSAEQLARTVEESPNASHIVLDTRRVGRATVSALSLLAELRREVADAGHHLLISGCPDELRAGLRAAGLDWPESCLLADTDTALERCEDEVLLAHRGLANETSGEVALCDVDILRTLAASDLDALASLLDATTYDVGDVIVHEGELADRLFFMLSGSATVRIAVGDGEGRTRRLRTFGPGTVFGEAALIDGGRRTATVVADEPITLRSLSVDALNGLATSEPQIHARLLEGLSPYLSEMLRRALGEIRALDG
jgi:glutaminase